MKRKTPFLSTERLSLKRGTFDDYMAVYEYDFRKLRDIAGEFTFEKLGFEKYEVIKDAWKKDGIMISDYKNIITKQKFYELYCKDI